LSNGVPGNSVSVSPVVDFIQPTFYVIDVDHYLVLDEPVIDTSGVIPEEF